MIPAASIVTSVTRARPIIRRGGSRGCRAAGFAARSRGQATPAAAADLASPAIPALRRAECTSLHRQQRDAEEDEQRTAEHEQRARLPSRGRARTGPRAAPPKPSAASSTDAGRADTGRTGTPAESRLRGRRRSAARASRAARAGRLARSVTMIPTASETTTVRVSKVRPLFGSVKPTASKSVNSPFARASPAKSPIDGGEDPDRRAPRG